MIKGFLLLLLTCCTLCSASQEICNNGIDDDRDGLIDLKDNDCTSSIFPLIPNPSFEEIYQCPTFYSQLQFAVGWMQPGPALQGSTDLYHTCGGCSYKFTGFASRVPMPVPDGVGFAGFIDGNDLNGIVWKENLSACLERRLTKDSTYVLDFYVGFLLPAPVFPTGNNFTSFNPARISLFGHPLCGALPYATTGNDSHHQCPRKNDSNWLELAKLTVTGNEGQWVRVRAEFTAPAHIGAIVIGPSCEPQPGGGPNHAAYYALDKILLYQKDPYDLPEINRSGDICADTLTLTAATTGPVPPNAWQWYRNNIALPGETGASLKLTRSRYGEGVYRARMQIGLKTWLSAETYVSDGEISFTLEDTVEFCQGTSIQLYPQIASNDSCKYSYRWQDGLTSINRTINTPGTYWFEIERNGCRIRDTVIALTRQAPDVNLGRDTTLCNNASLVLSAGNPGAQYQWQDNSNQPTFQVTQPGTFHVQVTQFGCTISDTIDIKYEKLPEIRFTVDTILCKDEEKQLAPYVYGNEFLWNTGSRTPHIRVNQPGTYSLQVQNQCGSKTDSIKLVQFDCAFWLPSAFTPNKDGKNDRFGLAVPGFVRKYDCRIFNRWGQLAFTSTDPFRHWDGTVNGKEATPGVYVWMIRYSDWTGKEYTKKGTVLLIR